MSWTDVLPLLSKDDKGTPAKSLIRPNVLPNKCSGYSPLIMVEAESRRSETKDWCSNFALSSAEFQNVLAENIV